MRLTLLFFMLVSSLGTFAQKGVIKGRIYNDINNEAIPFANVVIQGTTIGTTSDIDGKYRIENLEPGEYNIEVSFVGFKPKVIYEMQVTNVKATEVNVGLESQATEIETVEIVADPFTKKEESPVSMRTIGVSEIQRNPGGNRDISKVIQSLPGVSSTANFRNDIIIRGGAPNENRFYLDGIEVPNINHFATQGSSGGPVGLINVNFIREVDFFSGAFPANRGNALSSVFEFKQRDGNDEKLAVNFTLGSSDLGITLDGPVGEKSTFIFSARRSYLQFLFSALDLPFLPTYNDFQFKYKIKFDNKNQLSFIGLGALDNFALNTGIGEDETDSLVIERNQFLLGSIPEQDQWNYTFGANYKHFSKNSFQTVVLSRSHLNNSSIKYFNNDASDVANLILDYQSQEIENKLRFENTYRKNGWKVNAGVSLERITYTNNTFNRIALPGVPTPIVVDFDSELSFNRYGVFGQVSKGLIENRLVLSLGVRADGADYSSAMSNPLDQFSPRFSLAYNLTPELSFNFNVGRYFQQPALTVLGYRDSTNTLVNKNNGIKYIGVDHLVAGFEYVTPGNTKYTIEGFYKRYNDYPFLTNDSVALANLGADFGVIGNAPAVPLSEGRSYGVEFLAQRKLTKGIYGILAYTYVFSEFTDKNGDFQPSAWDNRHIVSLTAGYRFGKNWELGVRWRYLGGAPYTPVDTATSVLQAVFDVRGTGIPDYNRVNSLRLDPFHALDFRIDKKWFYDKWTLNLYLDVQNAYGFAADQPDILTVGRNANGQPVVDPNNPASYVPRFLENDAGTVLPSIGVIFEF